MEESFLAMAIMGIVIIQNLTMLNVWGTFLDWIAATTGITSQPVIFTLAFIVAVGGPVGLLALAARVAARGNLEGTRMNFARFGYALIPLDVAGHIAHNLFHLLAEGKSVGYTVATLFGAAPSEQSAALLDMGTIQVLQYVVLALGLGASLYAARRIAHGRYRTQARRRVTLVPVTALVVLLGALNVWMFALPMAHRM
jgi:hypothetical protein